MKFMIYPVVIAAALLGYNLLLDFGFPLGVSAYLAVFAAVVGIAAYERIQPERPNWQPSVNEAANDLTFLILVQMMLPLGLGLLVVLTLNELAGGWGWKISGLWPHSWPLWTQVVLMLVVAEFPRYWLHRLAHTWPPLWKFHAVHHAPKIIYWLNVGRFHPVDKTLQFVGDSLPFILVGVAPEVLKLYFVFYAVNGFFQHSNCKLRLGPLNWIISGPELHRWHHSILPEQSNTNYGNNLIIWDVLFRTRYLPAAETVDELGLRDRTYPTGFASQIAAPFTQKNRDAE